MQVSVRETKSEITRAKSERAMDLQIWIRRGPYLIQTRDVTWFHAQVATQQLERLLYEFKGPTGNPVLGAKILV